MGPLPCPAIDRRTTIFDAVAIGVVALVLRVPAYLASRHLSFDDGVFGASAVAMRAGGRPFSEVFSSQGPLFLPLVWVGDLFGFRTASSPRVLAVVAGVVLAVVVYLAGRSIADRAGALLAAGIVATSVGVLGVSAPLAADGPALAAGAIAVALALRWRTPESASLRRAVLLGVAVGVALSIKSLLAPAVVPVALVLLSWRRLAPIVVGAGTAVAVNLAVSLPWGWSDVWEQSYGYHLEVAGDRTPGANLAKTLSTLGDRELPLVVAAVLAIATVILARRSHAERAVESEVVDPRFDRRFAGVGRLTQRLAEPDVLLLGWLLATLGILLIEHPMWRPHVAHLVPAGALLVARHRPRWEWLAVAAVVVVPYHVVHGWYLLAPDPYRGTTAEAVDILRALPPDALAISDEPGIVWRAGRRTTDDLVDASMLRMEVEHITSEYLGEVAAQPDVCAVAVWSRVRWGSFDDLPDRLADAGYSVALEDDRGRTLWLKSDCEP